MSTIKIFVAVILLLTCINTYANADETLRWYEDRDEAFAIAEEQNKYVFLVFGKNSCGNCNAVKGHINEPSISEIVSKNFVLWYCNSDIQEKRAQAQKYRDNYDGSIKLPLVCVINPLEPLPALSYSIDYINANKIQEILTSHLPTSTEDLADIPNKVYISNKTLTISNENMNETIFVYTIHGQLIDSFDKKEAEIIRSAGSYPDGILLIKSSLGWRLKIINYANL